MSLRAIAWVVGMLALGWSCLTSASEQQHQPALDTAAIHRDAQRLPRLHSLLISRDGDLLFERYYNGSGRYQSANMKSASKSVISALVGIAIERGDVAGLQQPIADHFPDLLAEVPARKRAITIENLLTMEAGLASTSDDRTYGRWAISDNWVDFVLDQPMVADPGGEMIYSTGNSHLLSAIIERASGVSTLEYAERHLTEPLGMNITYWSQDPQGVYFGGNNMEMRPRDMLTFGRLYLNGGALQGKRILPAEWVERSYTPHADSPRGQGRHYGYGWWLRELADRQVPMAWGYGGQFIFVDRPLNLVVVATSESRPGRERFGHLRGLYDLVEQRILRPLAPSGATRQAAAEESR